MHLDMYSSVTSKLVLPWNALIHRDIQLLCFLFFSGLYGCGDGTGQDNQSGNYDDARVRGGDAVTDDASIQTAELGATRIFIATL
jgi:hypothetical protein